MSKISNCLLMLEYLENGRKYNIKELAEKLEVSERMVRSYKEELEKAGIFIDSIMGPYGGYVLNQSIKIPLRKFSKEDYEFLKTLNDYVIENTHEFNKEPVYLNRVGINNSYKYSYNFFKTINPIYAEYLEKRWNEAFIFCENNLYGVSNTFYDQKCHDTRIKLFVRKNISD